MFALKRVVVAVAVLVAVAIGQSSEPPLSETRLTIHTLVREDIFAGFLTNDLERLTRGEKSIEVLLEKRPQAKAELLAWKGGATLYRAVRAYENKQPEEFQQKYQQATDLFAQALQLSPRNGGVHAVTGGTYVIFGDRLPQEKRAAAWTQAYDSFQVLWKQQASVVDKMPVHLSGELLAGLAQAAQRTGRTEELPQYLDKIIEVLPNTPYEPIARQWKKNPATAANSTITCLTCHDQGRLSARLATLNK
jgi:tetratricopeptide (TPR) repeat protein